MEIHNLLPADTYTVLNKSIIHTEDRKLLNMLYLPIIGPLPVMLYFSLWSDLDKMEIISEEYTHHHLLTNMHASLEEIVIARQSLEAIGLLKTHFKSGNINNYIYELYSPLSAHEFLNHPILNMVLYSNVGKKEYDKIVNYYKIPSIHTVGYTDITKSFSDVFQSIPLTSYEIVNDNIRRCNKKKLNINTNFDLNFLISSMPKSLDLKKIFTKDNEELILNLAFLYDLDAMKISSILQSCINERGTINKNDLRKACRNYYQFDHGGVLPTVINRSQPEYLRTPLGDNSKRAKMIYTFETISPYDFLKSKNSSGEPTKRDVRLAETLIIDYGLKPGVVNVLMDYVLKTNNNKLTTSLVETIAGQWSRLKIENVEEAMLLAEKEHKKYKNKVPEKKVITPKDDHLPEWFDKEIKKEKFAEGEVNEIEEMLKEYR